MAIRELNVNEVNAVSGATLTTTEAAATTVVLMAMAPASIAVITAGTVALLFYATAKAMS